MTADEAMATLSLIRTFRRIACDCERQAKHYRAMNVEYAGKFPNGKHAFMSQVSRCIDDATRARSEARKWIKGLRNWKEFYREQ
jgi:hypothetical protein